MWDIQLDDVPENEAHDRDHAEGRELRPCDPEDTPPISDLDVARDQFSDEVRPMAWPGQRERHGDIFDAPCPVPLGLRHVLAP
jgi:hypothetical protein